MLLALSTVSSRQAPPHHVLFCNTSCEAFVALGLSAMSLDQKDAVECGQVAALVLLDASSEELNKGVSEQMFGELKASIGKSCTKVATGPSTASTPDWPGMATIRSFWIQKK